MVSVIVLLRSVIDTASPLPLAAEGLDEGPSPGPRSADSTSPTARERCRQQKRPPGGPHAPSPDRTGQTRSVDGASGTRISVRICGTTRAEKPGTLPDVI